MLTKVEQAKERYGGAHTEIDTWLNARQQLLVHYCELAGLPPFERKHDTMPSEERLEIFCEMLVDYVSSGHFEIYEKVTNGDASARQLMEQLAPKITDSTEQALAFNDSYTNGEATVSHTAFDERLSALGEALEERFELEDKLIQTAHSGSD